MHVYIKISFFSQIWLKQIQKRTEYLISEWIWYQNVFWMWNTTQINCCDNMEKLFSKLSHRKNCKPILYYPMQWKQCSNKRCFLLSLFAKQISRLFLHVCLFVFNRSFLTVLFSHGHVMFSSKLHIKTLKFFKETIFTFQKGPNIDLKWDFLNSCNNLEIWGPERTIIMQPGLKIQPLISILFH